MIPAAAVVDFIKSHKWAMALAAICVIPYFAFQAMKERTAEQPLSGVEFKLIVSASGDVTALYADGKRLPADGIGYLALTLEQRDKIKDQLPPVVQTLDKTRFPIVIFYNASGFDATGLPVMIRSIADGGVVTDDPSRFAKRVALVTPDGNRFKVIHADKTTTTVSEEEWYARYMGLQVAPKEEPKKGEAAELKTGLRIKVFKVGSLSIGEPLSVPVSVYPGKIEPFSKDGAPPGNAALAGMSAKDGVVLALLPPGTYTVVVEYEGQLRGNAVTQKAWPTVEVKDGITDYEFRVQP